MNNAVHNRPFLASESPPKRCLPVPRVKGSKGRFERSVNNEPKVVVA
jgi:hypothetical protein